VNQFNLDRRGFLRLSAVAAFATGAGVTLAGCTTAASTGGGGSGVAATSGALPTYVAYKGVNPDLAGGADHMAAFYAVPAEQVSAFSKPPLASGSITAMVNTFAPPPPSADSNAYWKALNASIGGELKLNLVPDADYQTKLTAVLAGGSLPDVVNLPLWLPRLGQILPSLFADLTPYLGGDHSKDYPYLANLPTDSWKPLIYDGKLYGVPTPRMPVGNVLFKRADLIQQLGLDPDPKSWDDFVALSKGVTSAHDKRWAMDDPNRLHTFCQASVGAPNNWLVTSSGDFQNTIETDAFVDATEKTVAFIKAGYLHPDGFSDTFDQTRSNFGTGQTVFHHDGYLAWDILAASYPEIGIDAIRPLTTPDGKAYQFTGAGALSISAVKKGDEKSVRRALDVLNWLAAPFGTKEYMLRKYGVEGTDYDMADGVPTLSATGTKEVALPLQYIVDSAPVLGPGPKDRIDAEYAYHKAVGPELLEDPTVGLYSDTFATQGGTIQKVVNDALREILLGHQKVSTWPDTVKKWRAAGGSKMADEYATAYAASKS
jgi:putative aldouronate transport system substrate-binding protein